MPATRDAEHRAAADRRMWSARSNCRRDRGIHAGLCLIGSRNTSTLGGSCRIVARVRLVCMRARVATPMARDGTFHCVGLIMSVSR